VPDPSLSGLLSLDPPGGLDLIVASRSPLALDPTAPGLDEYTWPAGQVIQAITTPDPMLPDLRQPDLEQQVHMLHRPGDLATGALDEMHRDATYQRLPTDQYRELWMQQAGDNQARERHMGMRMRGLDREEL